MIDALLHRPYWRDRRSFSRAIDVGTGSGVLAIVAAKMGVGFVCGIDSDSCAVFEARNNVRLNHIEDRVEILEGDLSAIAGSYELVFANLRMPTLFNLWSVLEKKVADNSMLVFSGLKSEEVNAICDFYEEAGFFLHRKRSEKGWSAICLARSLFLGEGVAPMALY